jgi:hypothetical protein
MSGLRINYQKSEVFVLGSDKEEGEKMQECLTVKLDSYHLSTRG